MQAEELHYLDERSYGVVPFFSSLSVFCQLLWCATSSKEPGRLGPIVEHAESQVLAIPIMQSPKVQLSHSASSVVHESKSARDNRGCAVH